MIKCNMINFLVIFIILPFENMNKKKPMSPPPLPFYIPIWLQVACLALSPLPPFLLPDFDLIFWRILGETYVFCQFRNIFSNVACCARSSFFYSRDFGKKGGGVHIRHTVLESHLITFCSIKYLPHTTLDNGA